MCVHTYYIAYTYIYYEVYIYTHIYVYYKDDSLKIKTMMANFILAYFCIESRMLTNPESH